MIVLALSSVSLLIDCRIQRVRKNMFTESQPPDVLKSSRSTTHDDIHARIPVGISVSEAVRQLEEAGCSCKHTWKEDDWTAGVWQVWVDFDDGRVTEVDSRMDSFALQLVRRVDKSDAGDVVAFAMR